MARIDPRQFRGDELPEVRKSNAADVRRCRIDSPVGALTLIASGGALTDIRWGGSGTDRDPVLDLAAREIADYFSRALIEFTVPLEPGGSPFQRRFHAALQAIPFGETKTYGELAAELGVSAQAIGQACGGNPIPIIIPCHRVLAVDGIGGYSGGGGIEAKVELLKLEGAASLLL